MIDGLINRKSSFTNGVTLTSFKDLTSPESIFDFVGQLYKTQLLLLGKFEYTGGPIFKVVLEC